MQERIRLMEAELGPAEQPIRDDLAAVGVHVSSAWDLVNTTSHIRKRSQSS